MRFRNRAQAGRMLAHALFEHGNFEDAVVLALPRGGVPVAFEVAKALQLPLDVYVVRKLGVPGDEEYAFGAIAGGDVSVFDEDVLRGLRLCPAAVDEVVRRERAELERRERAYRGGRPARDVRQRKVLVIDDGIATGATMRAAVRGLKQQGARAVVVAAPVVSVEALKVLQREAHQVLCVQCPDPFMAVGAWYRDFSQTTDDEVCSLLAEARRLVRKEPTA